MAQLVDLDIGQPHGPPRGAEEVLKGRGCLGVCHRLDWGTEGWYGVRVGGPGSGRLVWGLVRGLGCQGPVATAQCTTKSSIYGPISMFLGSLDAQFFIEYFVCMCVCVCACTNTNNIFWYQVQHQQNPNSALTKPRTASRPIPFDQKLNSASF